MSVAYANQILNRLKMAMDASATTDVGLPRELAHPIGISPWAVWLLLSLALHRGRQQFVLESMAFRLNGDADALAHAGALAHPDCPTVGLVPHDTEWEYRFHGRGCAMTNRLTGVVIDVDFLDETADWITPFFYVIYLESFAELLLKLKLNVDLHHSFLQIQSHSLGEAAILAMEFNLPCAIILIRRALRSNIPYNRIQIASALAIIDLRWCHMELKAVLDETTDQESTTECRSALLESRNADVHQFVHQWERKNPYSQPNEKYLTVGEWAKQRNDTTIQYEMQSLHDRIYPLRASFQPRTT